MGHYCCCGKRTREVCECEWDGWHDLEKNENDLPTNDGEYNVRWHEDGENHEGISKFSLIPKRWSEFSKPTRWEKDYWDGWTGWAGVYAWKNIKDKNVREEKQRTGN